MYIAIHLYHYLCRWTIEVSNKWSDNFLSSPCWFLFW
jgi:hypothetical protein